LDQQAARVVNVITDLNISISDGEEEIKMCDAMKQIIAEENAIAVLHKMISLLERGRLTAEEAAEECNLSVEDFLKKKEEYEKTKH
ncbi:MAG: hypothetical protein MR384_10580, partial [Lachnospiraceae bacterium]|nr:hypothetical protein [Lachnospiraceae bacterium]